MSFSKKVAKPTSSGLYSLQGSLPGHQGSVTSLSMTEDGKILASGGSDGVRLWEIRTMNEITRPTGAGNRGATSTLLWIRREDEPGEILLYGTQTGLLVCWKQAKGASNFEEVHVIQLHDPAEITGLAFDASTNRIAVCHRGSLIQVHAMDSKMKPSNIFSVKVDNYVPKAIAFGDLKGNNKEVIVFGFHDGKILTLDGETGAIVKSRTIGSMIGSADYRLRKGVYCVDDPFQGIVLFRAENDNRIRTFEVKLTRENQRPRQVCFTDDCSTVMSGSDHGMVYVFDRRTGDVTDTLRVDASDWVQTVTATEIDGVSTILAARSRDWGGMNMITIWKKTTAIVDLRWAKMKAILHILVMMGAVAFIYQNVWLRIAAVAGV
ncbi:WD40-repeat-containing domain protein [Mycena crocata]|nr:WD40-repeat-containing domain protein [Mycena crocata]